MKCSLENIHRLLDGQLDEGEKEQIQNHLLACPKCNRVYGKLLGVKKILQTLAKPKPPLGMEERVLESLKEVVERRVISGSRTSRLLKRRRPSLWPYWIAIAATFLIFLYFGFSLLWNPSFFQNPNGSKRKQTSAVPKNSSHRINPKKKKKERKPVQGISGSRKRKIETVKENISSDNEAPKHTPDKHIEKKFPKGPTFAQKKETNPKENSIQEKLVHKKTPQMAKKAVPSKTISPKKEAKKEPLIAKKPKEQKGSDPKKEIEKVSHPLSPKKVYRALAKKYLQKNLPLFEKQKIIAQMGGIPLKETYSFLQKILLFEKSPILRKEAVFALVKLGKPLGYSLALQGLKDSHWMVQDSVLDSFMTIEDEKGAYWIGKKLLFHKNPKIREIGITSLCEIGSIYCQKILIKALGRERSSKLVCKILLALGELKAYSAISKIARASYSQNWRVRAAFSICAGKLQDPKLVPFLKKLIRDPHPLVRKVSIQSLGAFQDPALASYLFKKYKNFDWAMKGGVRKAAEEFASKLSQNKDILKLSRVVEKEKQEYSFFGVPLFYDTIVFLVDVSDSMKTKLPLIKKILQKAIQALPKGVRFQILLFSTHIVPFGKTLVVANSRTKYLASKFIQKIQIQPHLTDLYSVLKEGFSYYPGCIFLFTDGTSTAGKYFQNPMKILREVKEWNFLKLTEIHTFGIFRSHSLEFRPFSEKPIFGSSVTFLKSLAEQNGGIFLHNY